MYKGWSHTSFLLLAARIVREGVLPILLLVTAAPAFVCSCDTLEETDGVPQGRDSSTTLYIEIGGQASKAPSWWLVRRLDVFTFNDSNGGTIDSYQLNREHISGGVTILSGTGRRTVAVIANMETDEETVAGIRSLEDLGQVESLIALDSPEYPVMSGVTSFECGRDKSCTVTLTPVLCELGISLRCSFVEGWKGLEMEEVQVFLTGVNGRAAIMDDGSPVPTEILNFGGLSEKDLQRLAVPRMLCQRIGRMEDGSKVSTSLFAYPNGTLEEGIGSTFTRIVVEGKVDGVVRQWAVPVKGLRRNTYCPVSITITRPPAGDG